LRAITAPLVIRTRTHAHNTSSHLPLVAPKRPHTLNGGRISLRSPSLQVAAPNI
jgi:hypothetical protein